MRPATPRRTTGKGVRGAPTQRYVTDLLRDPGNTLVVRQTVPDDSTLYGPYAGGPLDVRERRLLPDRGDQCARRLSAADRRVVPHMQRGAEAPIWADATARYPILLFSHGLTGSPMSDDYINALKLFASHGYVVVAAFHGDPRFADIELDSFEDAIYALLNFKKFVAMQALRPLSLVGPRSRSFLDNRTSPITWTPPKVGGFGASLGGESLLLMGGAPLTTTVGQASKQVLVDPRLKAAVGYVPYFGIVVFPAFGRDLNGLRRRHAAVSRDQRHRRHDGADRRGRTGHSTPARHAPARRADRRRARLRSALLRRHLHVVAGVSRRAALGRSGGARDKRAMTSMAGGGDDVLRLDYIAPSPPEVR